MSDDDLGDYFAGIGIALCSTACSAIGLVCQKLTHTRMSKANAAAAAAAANAAAAVAAGGTPVKPPPPQKPRYFTQPLWLLGIVSMVVGALLSFAVFNFLGQSRASAMASITIVWNGVLAALCLSERFTAWDALVTAVIITGASIAVAFGSVGAATQSDATIAGVVAVLSRTIVLVSGLIIAAAWVAVYIGVRRLAAKGKARSLNEVRLECYMRIFLSGIMTGVTGMLASSVVKAIGGGIRENEPLTVVSAYQFWLMLVCLPGSLVLQLGFLNSALAQLDALEIVPVYQAAVIIIGLLWGWLFTGDADGATTLSMTMFAVGCAISCTGVALLSLKRRMVPAIDAWLHRHPWAMAAAKKLRMAPVTATPATAAEGTPTAMPLAASTRHSIGGDGVLRSSSTRAARASVNSSGSAARASLAPQLPTVQPAHAAVTVSPPAGPAMLSSGAAAMPSYGSPHAVHAADGGASAEGIDVVVLGPSAAALAGSGTVADRSGCSDRSDNGAADGAPGTPSAASAAMGALSGSPFAGPVVVNPVAGGGGAAAAAPPPPSSRAPPPPPPPARTDRGIVAAGVSPQLGAAAAPGFNAPGRPAPPSPLKSAAVAASLGGGSRASISLPGISSALAPGSLLYSATGDSSQPGTPMLRATTGGTTSVAPPLFPHGADAGRATSTGSASSGDGSFDTTVGTVAAAPIAPLSSTSSSTGGGFSPSKSGGSAGPSAGGGVDRLAPLPASAAASSRAVSGGRRTTLLGGMTNALFAMPPVTEGEHDEETPFSHSSDEDGTASSYHHHGRHPSAGGFNASGAISGTAPNEFSELETESSPSTRRGGGFGAPVASPTVLGTLRAANSSAAGAGTGSSTTVVPPPLLPAQGAAMSPGKAATEDGQGISRQSSWSGRFSFRGRASTAGGIADASRGSASTQSPGGPAATHPNTTPSSAGTSVGAAGVGPASPGRDATAPSRLSVIASPGSDLSTHASHHHHHHHHHGGGHRTRSGRARTSTVGDISSVLGTDTHATDASILLLSSLGHIISDGISSLQEAVNGGGAAAGGPRARAGTDGSTLASTGQVHDAARRACAALAAGGSPAFPPTTAPGSPVATAAGTGISSATSSIGSASSGIVAGGGAAGRSPAQADSYYAVTHRDMGGKGGISLSVTFDLAAAGTPAAAAPAAATQEQPTQGALHRSLSAESGLRLSISGAAAP